MSYKKVISHISHWHEHEIHDRISAILGYDTWSIGTARYFNDRDEAEEIDLTLDFSCREDYERCVAAIIEARNMTPT